MARVTSMNGQPLAYASWTDFGQSGRRHLLGYHLTLGTAARRIFRDTEPRLMAGREANRTYWITDMAGRTVAGPYSREQRPTRAERDLA